MTEALIGLVAVALGSALGGAGRFFISSLVGRVLGEAFPWGTLAVNISGAAAIGVVAAVAARQGLPAGSAVWQAIVVGFLGGYTTVSSLSLQSLALAQQGARGAAGINIVLSIIAGLAAAAAGYAVGAAFA